MLTGWSGASPDMNIIKNMWSKMQQCMDSHFTPPQNKNQLKKINFKSLEFYTIKLYTKFVQIHTT